MTTYSGKHLLASIITMIAFAHYLATLFAVNLYEFDIPHLPISINIGPIRGCTLYKDDHHCEVLDRCTLGLPETPLGKPSIEIIDDCNTFRTGVAFLIIGCIISLITCIHQLLISYYTYTARDSSSQTNMRMIAFGLGISSSICGIIAMSIFVYLYRNDHSFLFDMNTNHYGWSFILLCIGWPVHLLTSFIFLLFSTTTPPLDYYAKI